MYVDSLRLALTITLLLKTHLWNELSLTQELGVGTLHSLICLTRLTMILSLYYTIHCRIVTERVLVLKRDTNSLWVFNFVGHVLCPFDGARTAWELHSNGEGVSQGHLGRLWFFAIESLLGVEPSCFTSVGVEYFLRREPFSNSALMAKLLLVQYVKLLKDATPGLAVSGVAQDAEISVFNDNTTQLKNSSVLEQRSGIK